MRTLPTRRELVFIFALLVAAVLFFQFTSDTQDPSSHDYDHKWEWLRSPTNKNGSTVKTTTKPPSREPPLPLTDDGARETQFIPLRNKTLPATEMLVHVPGRLCSA